jgi:hypothetical protein
LLFALRFFLTFNKLGYFVVVFVAVFNRCLLQQRGIFPNHIKLIVSLFGDKFSC